MFNKIYISPFQISPSQWSRNRPQSLRGAYSFWFFFASYLHWFASLWFPGWPAHFLVCWRKLSILIRHRLNSMVWNFASWHKLSILFRLLSNPMGLDEFVFANFPSFSGIGWIRWAEICLLAQTLHPLPASAESDGLKFCFLTQTLHPFPASAESDGLEKLALAQTLHLF